ncbi:MAG: ion channel [bacterium]
MEGSLKIFDYNHLVSERGLSRGVLKETFLFPYKTMENSKDISKLTERWKDKEEVLKNILLAIKKEDKDWENILKENNVAHLKTNYEDKINYRLAPTFNELSIGDIVYPIEKNAKVHHIRDLRGTSWENVKFDNKTSKMIEHASLDYCCFEDCNFTGPGLLLNEHVTLINTWFINCSFDNINWGTTIENSLFFGCKFNNVWFMNETRAKNIMFDGCDFNNVSIAYKNIEAFGFLDESSFKDVRISSENPGEISTKIIKLLRSKNYSSSYIRRIYNGNNMLYKQKMLFEKEKGNQDQYIKYHYYQRLFETKAQKGKISFIARYVVGFGDRPLFPLFWWLGIVLSSSFLFLFAGIKTASGIIQYHLSFPINDISQIFIDWISSLYFSITTATTVGFGDVVLANHDFSSLLLTIVLVVISPILMSTFIVLLARKYFD